MAHALAGEIEIEEHHEVVRGNESKPDPDWSCTDAAGHEHRFVDPEHSRDISDATYRESEEYWCEDCLDTHTDTEVVCTLCGEQLHPAYVTKYVEKVLRVAEPTFTALVRLDAELLASHPGFTRLDGGGFIIESAIMRATPITFEVPGLVEGCPAKGELTGRIGDLQWDRDAGLRATVHGTVPDPFEMRLNA